MKKKEEVESRTTRNKDKVKKGGGEKTLGPLIEERSATWLVSKYEEMGSI